ncbi:uncharacterized protein LOC109790105 [Cajanus cajan]|uniref:uncharacterized protein LOC109790105 n=1 Tax=Cajanus cajan TaxID=3821 RepID=UPI00098D8724|nr:uncharacterized protein LOC109790105 [Cajanus cajan]
MKAQSEICAAFLGRTRATKNRPDQPLQPASAGKRSRKVEEPKPPEDLVFQQQSVAAGGVDGGGDERQQSPVHGISLKLQEEEREHRMDFVPRFLRSTRTTSRSTRS